MNYEIIHHKPLRDTFWMLENATVPGKVTSMMQTEKVYDISISFQKNQVN